MTIVTNTKYLFPPNPPSLFTPKSLLLKRHEGSRIPAASSTKLNWAREKGSDSQPAMEVLKH